MTKKNRSYSLDLKQVDEAAGTFEGELSVYGVVDLGGDSVERGAFNKSIAERGAEIPLLWQHDTKQPIGILELQDTPTALKVQGRLVLAVERAREALALMKAGALRGMSIGYEAKQSVMDGKIRRLKEIKLFEGSLVTFPMLELAQVDLSSVKASGEPGDFDGDLSNIQTWSARYQMMQALDSSLDGIILKSEASLEERREQVVSAIDQFREKYLDLLPSWFALMEGKTLTDLIEAKAGRRISSTTRSQIEEAITKLSALLEDSAGEDATEEAGAAKQDDLEPASDHSWLLDLKSEINGELSTCVS